MVFDDILKIEEYKKAPKCGNVLAYLRKEVVLEKYNSEDELKSILGNSEILELHLFDNDKELRCLMSESKRFPGLIAYLEDIKEDPDNTYKEDCFLDNGDKLTVLNHIVFDESGMASIDSYRLTKGGC